VKESENQMTLLDVALDCVRRGWYVFPCKPQSKRPMTLHGFKDATLDEATIRAWWEKTPDANPAISTGPSKLLVVDNDHGLTSRGDATAWMERNGFPLTYAVRTGRRPEFGLQLYYQADGSRGCAGWKLNGCAGDIRAEGGYVMAAGSIHPDSGEAYTALLDGTPVAPAPQRVKDLAPETRTYDPATAVDDATADEWKTWLLEYMGRNKIEPRDFEKRAPNGYWLGIHCPWEEQHGSGPGAESSTVLGILDGKVAFECSHGTCKSSERDTAVFKQLMTLMHNEAAREPGADPPVVIGSPKPKPEPAKMPGPTRPVYPMDAWDDTVVGTFARLCGEDNNVPLKMYAEAFRCVLGAIVGDQIACPNVEGVTPRTYTVLVVPFGKGKGTAIGRAMSFFEHLSGGGVIINGRRPAGADSREALLTEKPFPWQWATEHVGAWVAGASSAPGMARLANIERPKPKREKDKPEPPPQPPLWGEDLPRVLSVFEEAKNLFSSLSIEGGVGHATTGAICGLWDSNRFYGTATGERAPASGRMLFSMLCGVTESDWFDLLGRGDIVGGGLMSRLNICGTMGEYANVSRLRPPDFNPLRRVFLPRIHELSNTPADIPASAGALDVVDAWVAKLPAGSERMNIHVWRSALLLSWLRGESEITGDTARDAARLGDYQVATHEYYRTEATDNATAYIQQKMERVLRSKGPLSRAALFKHTNGKRDGTVNWGRALDSMVQNRLFGIDGKKIFAARAED